MHFNNTIGNSTFLYYCISIIRRTGGFNHSYTLLCVHRWVPPRMTGIFARVCFFKGQISTARDIFKLHDLNVIQSSRYGCMSLSCCVKTPPLDIEPPPTSNVTRLKQSSDLAAALWRALKKKNTFRPFEQVQTRVVVLIQSYQHWLSRDTHFSTEKWLKWLATDITSCN